MNNPLENYTSNFFILETFFQLFPVATYGENKNFNYEPFKNFITHSLTSENYNTLPIQDYLPKSIEQLFKIHTQHFFNYQQELAYPILLKKENYEQNIKKLLSIEKIKIPYNENERDSEEFNFFKPDLIRINPFMIFLSSYIELIIQGIKNNQPTYIANITKQFHLFNDEVKATLCNQNNFIIFRKEDLDPMFKNYNNIFNNETIQYIQLFFSLENEKKTNKIKI